MKYKLFIIILTLISCKTEPKKTETEINCILSELTKTTDYKIELEKFAKINYDTLIEIEKIKVKNIYYKTIFDLKENENSLWLLRESPNKKTDSILLHYEDNVEYFLKIDSEFDFENCEIKITEEVYYTDKKPEKSETKTIKL